MSTQLTAWPTVIECILFLMASLALLAAILLWGDVGDLRSRLSGLETRFNGRREPAHVSPAAFAAWTKSLEHQLGELSKKNTDLESKLASLQGAARTMVSPAPPPRESRPSQYAVYDGTPREPSRPEVPSVVPASERGGGTKVYVSPGRAATGGTLASRLER